MCYQVIERHSFCRCLYYKHSVDPCSAHGQRGHIVQEKTVLVGYACSSHSDFKPGPYAAGLEDQDIVDVAADSTDGSDDDESVFSSAITLSRATSFIAGDEQDTVEEVLHMLANDPLLCWERLSRHENEDPGPSNIVKDVRFFLGAFETDLRKAADSTMEHHACAFLRSRMRYLSSRICERFNLEETTAPGLLSIDDETTSKSIQQLLPVTLDEPDPTLVPAFTAIRNFIFGGVAFQALRENIRNFTQSRRDYRGEMTDIITKNIHPPDLDLVQLSKIAGPLHKNLEAFLRALLTEAMLCDLSAGDRVGIKNLQVDTEQLTVSVSAFWTRNVPIWHFYPPILGKRSCGQSDFLSSEDRDGRSEYEIFEEFICSSKAFLHLSQSVARLSRKNNWKRRLSQYIQRLYTHSTSAIPSFIPGRTAIFFECSCGKTIIDDYLELSAGGISSKQRQLRLLSVRQRFEQAASQNSKQGNRFSSVQNFLASFTRPAASSNAQLPQHQPPGHMPAIAQDKNCNTQTRGGQHNHNFVHWCIPSSRYATHMLPLQSCQINSDLDFFVALKERYNQSKRKYQTLLSLKKPVALRFVKFRLYHRHLVDIHEIGDIPPESHKDEYDYSPMPAETIPPIGSNLLMHFSTHPHEAASQPVLLPCIPKRKNNRLEPCPIRGSSLGWGLDVITAVDELKLFGLGLLGSLASVIFGLAWAVGKGDIQGGFAVAGFMFALIAFAIASLKALDF